MRFPPTLSLIGFALLMLLSSPLRAQTERPEGCTTITVGKLASADGSVITSHTLDDHRSWTTIDIQPPREHVQGAAFPLFKVSDDNTGAMPAYRNVPVGEIPQVPHTHGYINSSLPCMNDQQLAIGESTFGGTRIAGIGQRADRPLALW